MNNRETCGTTTTSTKRQSSVMEYLDNMDKKIGKTLKQLARALHCLSKGDSNIANVASDGNLQPIKNGDFEPSNWWTKSSN